MQADYIKFAFKIPNFRYRCDGLVWRKLAYIVQLHSVTPEQPLGYLVKNRGRIVIQKSSCCEFSVKIFQFSLQWQQGSSEQSSIKLADPENPLVGPSIWGVSPAQAEL